MLIVRVLSIVKFSHSVNEREGLDFHHASALTKIFLVGVDCAFLVPKLLNAVHVGPAKVRTGEPLFLEHHFLQYCNALFRRKRRCLAQACSRPLPFYRLKDEDPAPLGEVEKELVDNSSTEEADRLWFETGEKGDELGSSMSTPDQLESVLLPETRVEVLTVELVNEELGGFREVAGDDQCITMNEDVLHC